MNGPPTLPTDELLTMATALAEYGRAYFAYADEAVSSAHRNAAHAQGDDLLKAARAIRRAADYWGHHESPPWAREEGAA